MKVLVLNASRRSIRIASAIVLAVLAGCAVGPNYHRPKVETPPAFRGAATSTNSLAELPWWDVFQDEPLRELIHQALTNNYDVRIALSRVVEARAVVWQNRAGLFPQLGYLGGVSRGKNASGNTPVFENARTLDSYSVAGTASWEIDVWGRVRRLTESAQALYFASEEARRDAMVTVLSDVASTYFQLLAVDEQMEIARRSTNSFGESLRIFSQRLQGGIVSKLEASAAEAALASAAANVPEFERQTVVLENALSVLVGRTPSEIHRSRKPLRAQTSPEIPPGLPSSLLQRRPDIREAEENLHSANAQIGVAVANFFPQLSLTALFGQVNPELTAFTSGAANAWSIGANLAGPIFQGGRLIGQYRQAVAAREEARLRYEATVLRAMQEVANALVGRQKYAEAQTQQMRAVEAYRVAVQVATERYVAGRAGYFEVLQEQQLLFPSENALIQTQLNEMLAYVQLYRALGGGWNTTK